MKLELVGIHKSFGKKHVLKDIALSAESGQALGLLGRNGAGKTTSIRIAMNVFPADAGQVLIDGKPVSHSHLRFGYLPEERGLYPKKPIGSQLIYMGELRGLKHADAVLSAKQWLERVELSDYFDKKLDTLSKGNQQKIQLAATLLHDPDVVILDEPFSGLDPVNAEMLKNIVRDLVRRGKIVIFSSHQMHYVEEFCDDIAILNEGRIVLSGNLRSIKRGYSRRRVLLALDDPQPLPLVEQALRDAGLMDRLRSIKMVDDNVIVHLRDTDDRDALFGAVARANLRVDHFEVLMPSLEQIFVEKAGESI